MLEVRARLREYRRTPGYLIAVLFSLSTGMAVCVAVFSIVNSLVFADVPGLARRTALVRLVWSDGRPFSRAEFGLLQQQPPPCFERVAAQGQRTVAAMLPSGAATVAAAFVSSDYFPTLRTTAVAGRLLTPADASESAAPAAVISETLWRSAFGGEPTTIGRVITIARRSFTIVGVAPHGFPGLSAVDVDSRDANLPQVFLPLRFQAMFPATASPQTRSLSVAGRLSDGTTLAAAREAVAVIGKRLPEETPVRGAAPSLRALRMGLNFWDFPGESTLVILVYLFVPLGVLAIGCGNVVNLQLARAVEHAGELSVRLALGASGRLIARLLSIEIIPIATVAALLGWAGARVLLAAAESFVPVRFALDGRALVFAGAMVGFATTFSGVLPGWLAARDVVAAGLRVRHGAPAHTRTRYVLVVAQVAASVTLLSLAVLAARTLQARTPARPLDARSTLVADFDLTDANPHDPQSARFVNAILETLAQQPAVRAAGFSDFFLSGHPIAYRFSADSDDVRRVAVGGVVSPGWFEATQATLVAGRVPTAAASQTFEAAVNAPFAAAAGLTASTVLGSSVRVPLNGTERSVEIVGVLATASRNADESPAPMLILPMPAIPPSSLVLTVRAVDVERARDAIALAVKQYDPSISYVPIETLDARLAEAFRGFRDMTTIAAVVAMIALLLASAGLYALMAYTVRRRTREIGIRLAVGAGPGQVVMLVVRVAAALVLFGGLLGYAIATPIAFAMRAVFFGLSPLSPWSTLPIVALLLLISAAAAATPIYRAARIDPIAVLREP